MQDNLMQIVGNLGYPPETKHFDSGSRLTTFSVAVYAGKDKPANWVKVNAWNEVSDQMPQALDKGDRVFVRWDPSKSVAAVAVEGAAKLTVGFADAVGGSSD